jgi:uncharacterized protein
MNAKAASPETPEYYRRRYEELKARAAHRNAVRPAPSGADNPAILPAGAIVVEETIPAFWYWTQRIARGDTLRIVNDHATPGVSVLLWNAEDSSERYNPADSVKVQWTSRLTRGKVLLSDMGRVLASLTADRCGFHDCLAGGSTPQSNARKYGPDNTLRNTRDNFLLAAAKLGLTPRDVGPSTCFFAPLTTDGSGRFVWQEGRLSPGDFVDLRAEAPLLVALSNCPHPLSPGTRDAAQPVRAMVWRSPPPEASDLCRTASEEAIRAFENNDAVRRR